MEIRIEATGLPGRACGPGPNFPGYANIHVGLQRRNRPAELLDPHPGDAPTATWSIDCAATNTPTGIDVTGRYVQGRPTDRFIYLSWGTIGETGEFSMFRRAKLMLDAIDPDVLRAATRSGRLVARLRLTDASGQPLCAQVRPPQLEWIAG
ncbi:DUF5990 family protein [Pseudonocardia acaciae]|uniref:DUF5990 family protein n=1 Tax=Pseudonocardia acaciae TaxID=551276 RepID=UPI00048E7033|nr:DUF5990 family protein [Pseudonocardia acaciae]